MTKLVIYGAAGRMGRRLVSLAIDDPNLQLLGAVEYAEYEQMGIDAGRLVGMDPVGALVSSQIDPAADVAIDFSTPAATRQALEQCVEKSVGLVIGTTGLDESDHQRIDEAAKTIPILQAPNMSLGVNLLFALSARAASILGDDYDIEIVEAHHRFKQDAPSGTALGIAEAICGATDRDMNKDLVHGRSGTDAKREPGQIGMHALRIGDVVGEHTAVFAALGERVELKHVATDRDIFVRGALKAAAWLSGKSPGRYHMADVLGLE
jgi:4-hydroxy-tetrahydrodipicolinate reductase